MHPNSTARAARIQVEPTTESVVRFPSPKPQTRAPSPDVERPRLDGNLRRDFERPLLTHPALKGSARALLRMLLNECFRGHCDTWHGNRSLAEQMGCSEPTVWRGLKVLESAGVLVIVDDHRIRGSQRRLILKSHPDAERLIAELKSDPLVQFNRTSGKHLSGLADKTGKALSDRRKGTFSNRPGGPFQNEKPDLFKLNTESSSRNREPEASRKTPLTPPRGEEPGREDVDSTTRQETIPAPPPRSAPPRPRETPPRAAQEPRHAIPEPVRDTKPIPAPKSILASPGASWTEGQLAFLAALDEGQRAAFDAWPPTKQAGALAPHRLGFDPVIARDVIRRLGPSAPPPPPLPATTAEILEQLGGAPREWVQAATEALVRDFGREKDRKLWDALRQAMERVRLGEIPAAAAAHAYGRAMEPEVRNRGAYFWTSFQEKAGVDP